MKANARLVIEAIDGTAFAQDVRSTPPFAVRRVGHRFLIVGSAAAPVGGDELSVSIEVLPGACADVGTVAATLVWPGPSALPSRLTNSMLVRSGAHLRWRPEPIVAIVGSDHVATTSVELEAGATCEIEEHVVLGRRNERSGAYETLLRVTRDARPLLHHRERFGPHAPGDGSLALVGPARYLITRTIIGRSSLGPTTVGDPQRGAAARLTLAPDAEVTLVAAPHRTAALRCLDLVDRSASSSQNS